MDSILYKSVRLDACLHQQTYSVFDYLHIQNPNMGHVLGLESLGIVQLCIRVLQVHLWG
jgi:hypothetical protein